jgi:HEAT repeat protein
VGGIIVIVACAVAFKDPILEEWYLRKFQAAGANEKWALSRKLESLGDRAREAAEEWYLHEFRSGNQEQQKAAAERLGEMGAAAAIPAMLAALKNAEYGSLPYRWIVAPPAGLPSPGSLPNSRPATWKRERRYGQVTMVRLNVGLTFVLDSLEEIALSARQASVPHLLSGLDDDLGYTCHLVAALLGEIGPDARLAVPALVGALKERKNDLEWGDAARCLILWALGQIGPEARESIPLLAGARGDENEFVRRAAAEALEKIEGPSR